MASIALNQATPTITYTGTTATQDLFGANFLFTRDGAFQRGEVSKPYQEFARETGLSTLRYPGGTMTEEKFDMANPNDDRDPAVGEKGYVPMSTFLDYAASIGASATIVIPTYRLFTDQFNALGQRIIDPEAEPLVRQFIRFALQQAEEAGTKIAAFELGNEWWVDNSTIFGFQMTPVEYGRIANFLAKTVQEEIDNYNASQAPWDKADPDIVVQVGPGGNAEWYSRAELGIPNDGANTEISATEVIFRQILDPVSQMAIDGIVTHRYLHGTDDAITGWIYNPFLRWESLARATPGFNQDFSKYVSEWNVSARNPDEIGLKQFDSMVLLIKEMMIAGVDLANVWAVQQNNATRMIYNTGSKDAPYGGLAFGGLALDMMAAQLPGLRVIQNSGELAGLQCAMFGSDTRLVYFLTNKTGVTRDDTISKTTVPLGTTHVSIYEVTVGADGRPTVSVRTYRLEELPNSLLLQMSVDETVVLVFTKGQNGATIEGYDLADSLVGTVGADSIGGGPQDDTIIGSGGNDTIWGEAGSDQLIGGGGNDSLIGGSGIDIIYGGEGDDFIIASPDADTVFGGSGIDTLVLEGWQIAVSMDLGATTPTLLPSTGLLLAEFENLIAGFGNDSVRGNSLGNSIDGMGGDDFIDGLAGNDTLIGGDGNDRILAGTGDDRVYGGSGNDCIRGDEGSDLLVGGEGNDLIDGGDGDDVIEGNAGDDVLNGNSGADILLAGWGDDTVFGGAGYDRVFGGAGNDFLFCDEGDDYANGGVGDDQIFGGAGADTLNGNDGDDIVFGSYSIGVPNWFLRGLYDSQLRDSTLEAVLGRARDQPISTDAERISGGLGNDILFGGAGDDRLDGNDGDDWLFGLGGQDTLEGGFGNDTFVLNLDAGGRTEILDFRRSADSLILTGSFDFYGASTVGFVDQFASKVEHGVLIDVRNGTEFLIVGLEDPTLLYDSLRFLSM